MVPTGHIIFQNCDGVYQVVGNYRSSLSCIEGKIDLILDGARGGKAICVKEDQKKYLVV